MIYCLEDDNSIRELVLYTLKASNYEARGFENAASFWSAMKEQLPKLIILDIMLPDGDGIDILKKLKDSIITESIPVIITSAKGTEFDKVIGLDCGADDYLAKPFGMMEMLSRIKAVLRRTETKESPKVLSIGTLELNESSHNVYVEGEVIELTLKEYELLSLFLKHPGQAFSREALLSSVWDSDYLGETRTVDVHIASLRTKLGKAGDYIKTIRGVGYRLEGKL